MSVGKTAAEEIRMGAWSPETRKALAEIAETATPELNTPVAGALESAGYQSPPPPVELPPSPYDDENDDDDETEAASPEVIVLSKGRSPPRYGESPTGSEPPSPPPRQRRGGSSASLAAAPTSPSKPTSPLPMPREVLLPGEYREPPAAAAAVASSGRQRGDLLARLAELEARYEQMEMEKQQQLAPRPYQPPLPQLQRGEVLAQCAQGAQASQAGQRAGPSSSPPTRG